MTDRAGRSGPLEGADQYELRRNALAGDPGIMREAEACVVARITNQSAAPRTGHHEPRQARLHQRDADSLALALRHDRERTEREPARALGADLNGGKRDMPDDLPVLDRNQAHRKRAGRTQILNDPGLAAVAVGMTRECGLDHMTDGGPIGRPFVA